MPVLPYLSATELIERVTPRQAVDAILDQLRDGFDPASDFARQDLPLDGGSVLIMPSKSRRYFGIKVATVADPGFNAEVPRIQGTYTLFAAESLSPVANIDAAALTLLRTPAVTFAAILPTLEKNHSPLKVVCFGTGPLGAAHVSMLEDLMSHKREIQSVTFVGLREQSTLSRYLSIKADSSAVSDAVSDANLIICATSSSEPLFTSELVRSDCVIAAVGSHVPFERELDSDLMSRSNVIVEDVQTALREAGDVVIPVVEGRLASSELISIASVARGEAQLNPDVPTVFKSSGMSWEDLAVASLAYESSQR